MALTCFEGLWVIILKQTVKENPKNCSVICIKNKQKYTLSFFPYLLLFCQLCAQNVFVFGTDRADELLKVILIALRMKTTIYRKKWQKLTMKDMSWKLHKEMQKIYNN